jgi:di/tripeptidase
MSMEIGFELKELRLVPTMVLGVAMIMADFRIYRRFKHPAIEALFTIDEETGMTGALNLKGGIVTR